VEFHPPAVREEQPDSAVPQHLLLRAPARQQAPAPRRRQELGRQHGGVAFHQVGPHDPQERVAAVGEAPRELHQLLVAHHGDAPVVHVHHGPGLLDAVQPVEAGPVLLPEVGAQRV
jgi:hypothetical protein